MAHYVNKINGSVVVSAMINGYLVTRAYYGYTVKEAKQIFKAEEYGQCYYK